MIPSAALRQTITIAPFLGESAYGPRFGAGVTVRARVQGKRRQVRRADGTDVISSATATIRPRDITPESKVTWDGRDYTVLDVIVAQGLTRTSHIELVLS